MSTMEMIKIGTDEVPVMREGEHGWMPLKAACEVLGIDPIAQRRRLLDSPWSHLVTKESVAADGKSYEMTCLRADRVAMWLATIETSRLANDEARAKLVMWQCEAAEVLDRWVRGGVAEHIRPAALPSELERRFARLLREFGDLTGAFQQNLGRPVDECCSNDEMAEAAGFCRAKFYRLLKKHPEVRELNKRGGKWMVTQTLLHLEALGLYHWPDKTHLTGPEMRLAIQNRKPNAPESDIDTSDLLWQMCRCHSEQLDGCDRGMMAALLSLQGMVGMGAMTEIFQLDEVNVRRRIRSMAALGYIKVVDLGPGKTRRYTVNRELVSGHVPGCDCNKGDVLPVEESVLPS